LKDKSASIVIGMSAFKQATNWQGDKEQESKMGKRK
jgi:hypothetical protein